MKKSNILITGVSGFLGQQVWKLFSQDPSLQLIGLDKQDLGQKEFIDLDLSTVSRQTLAAKIPKKLDTIIHLAAVVNFSKEFNPELFRVNVCATNSLADVALERNARFVFASSVSIYGTEAKRMNLHLRPNPVSHYALSKWLAEQCLFIELPAILILRFGGIFGLFGPTHLTLNRMINAALRDAQVPKISGRGTAKRNYIYVKDAANAVKYGFDKNLEGEHLIGGIEIKAISEMALEICEIFLPQSMPLYLKETESEDQIIESSEYFPPTRSFKEALKDIERDYADYRHLG